LLSCVLSAVCLLPATANGTAQEPYKLSVRTNEVALSFHAVDQNGKPVTDLIAGDLRILDDGKPAQKITLFVHHAAPPLRLAILFDMSASMQGAVSPRQVAQRVAAGALTNPTDKAMVLRFDFDMQLQQDWTDDTAKLVAAGAHVTDKNGTRLGGTAIWDSVYKTCRDHMAAQTPGAEEVSNAIIIFTDGIDNRSHALLQDAVEECQRRQTAIYAFVIDGRSHFDSGQKELRSLTEMTGGRVFYQEDIGANVTESILQINEELRDRYTVAHQPKKVKLDGKLHTVKLEAPHRTAFFKVRNGYFAVP
jgi:VWFA-related protein